MDLNATDPVLVVTYSEIYALIPCIVLGIISGFGHYFQQYINDPNYVGSWRKLVGTAISSAIMSFVVFALLDNTDLSFVNKIAISSLVAFLGIDKLLELAQKLASVVQSLKGMK